MATKISAVVGQTNRNVPKEYVVVNGVYRKVKTVYEVVNGVYRKVWTAIPPYDPTIPGTFTISLDVSSGDNGKSGSYTTLYSRAKANEAIANGYNRIAMNVNVNLLVYDWQVEYKLYNCITSPSNFNWGRDQLVEWHDYSGSGTWKNFTGTLSWSLQSSLNWSSSGNQFGFFVSIANYHTSVLSRGTVSNVRFTK